MTSTRGTEEPSNPLGNRQPSTVNQRHDQRETRDQPLTTDYRLLTTDYRLHFSTDFPILRLHLARRSCVETQIQPGVETSTLRPDVVESQGSRRRALI
jgi:hypothetical protein